jgi:hypothetical protein
MMIDAMTCPDNFFSGANGAISSRKPKKKIIISEAIIKRCSLSKKSADQIVNENKEAAKIAIPPNNGIGFVCNFLSLGSSNSESRLAILMMEGIDANATMNAVKRQRKKFSITLQN